uniref:Cytochrome b n=1 Tax=Romanomermis culicivorax TaxID=13658 RepID=A0A915HGL5_ROMCU
MKPIHCLNPPTKNTLNKHRAPIINS